MLCFPYPSYPLESVTQVFFLLQCGKITGEKIRKLGGYIPIPTEDKQYGSYRVERSCYSLEGMQSACMTSPTQCILRRTKRSVERSGDTTARLC